MLNEERIELIRQILKMPPPNVKTQLNFNNPFELPVATILSARCTDKQVNFVSGELFKKFPASRDISEAPIEQIIGPTGYDLNKAMLIQNCSMAIVKDVNREVSDTLELLLILPGIGRKTGLQTGWVISLIGPN